MKHLFLIAGAALLFAAPVAAKHNKHEGREGHGKHQIYVSTHGKHASKHDRHNYYNYGRANCPPGLRLRDNMCMPRGQYRKMYSRGQRYPRSYGQAWSYDQIPYDLRSRYDFDRSNRYYYSDGYLYQVDPRTLLVERVVNAILR
ncbi:MAG: hypothetical protein ABIS38_04160 [Sphingomicrobium sp.]